MASEISVIRRTGGVLVPLLPRGRIDHLLYFAQTHLRNDTLLFQPFTELMSRLLGEEKTIILPSHFFQYPQRLELSSWLAEHLGSSKVFVQISPGVELLENWFELTQMNSVHFGVEIVFDRPLSSTDWQSLSRLEDLGFLIRYVFCPTRLFSARTVLSTLPESIFKKTSFYFPKKITEDDPFLNLDEALVTFDEIPKAIGQTISVMEYVRLDASLVPSTSEEIFNVLTDSERWSQNFANSDSSHRFAVIRLRVTGAILSFTTSLFYLQRHPRIVLDRIWGAMWARLIVVRNILIIVRNILVAPAWFSKTYCPPLYWVFFFPILKVFWFVSFQFQKLRRVTIE